MGVFDKNEFDGERHKEERMSVKYALRESLGYSEVVPALLKSLL